MAQRQTYALFALSFSLIAAAASAQSTGTTRVDPRPSIPQPKDLGSPSLATPSEDGKEVVQFPLIHTRVSTQVTGSIARVEVTQYYQNPTKNRLEAVYAFPLPANAAVTDMAFRIGKRLVLSEVRRREEAKQIYEEAKEKGKTAALTEQERPNLFTQSVANIPPGETVAVLIRYVHEVPFDDGRYLFHFPTTIGPRYLPASGSVKDPEAVTPPVMGPGYRSAHDVEITVRLTPGAAFSDVGARSHRIVTGLDERGDRIVALAEDDRTPNKDFVLAWRPVGERPRASALVERERGDDYFMLFVQPPVDVKPAFVRPKEMVFLLDKSGSMSGKPIDTAKALVVKAIEGMGPNDTFQVVAFEGSVQQMSPEPLANTAENVRAARQWLGSLEGGGGTEMLSGIRAALQPSRDPTRVRMVVFCTDGFIGNETEIIGAVEQGRGTARVFGFGIGESVNRYLIDGMARAGRGASEVVSLNDPVEESVARLYKRLDRPVLTDLSLRFEGISVSEILPERLPDLHAGQPLVVVGKVTGKGPAFATLSGKLGTESYKERIAIDLTRRGPPKVDPADPVGAGPVLGTLWARRKIEDLTHRNPGGVAPDDKEAVIALALRFKLVTQFTSFVAVERELLADPSLPLEKVLVPNEMPEGVSHKGIFGEETGVVITPARVKPGDPEIFVRAPPTAVSVRVKLPFEKAERDAAFDRASGTWVRRFLVPPQWPDGSYEANVTVVLEDGRVEKRTAALRVDTTPASIAVISAPTEVHPGETIRLIMKPSLALSAAAGALGKPGGAAAALKGAMEVKEVLVRAPWGEIARARMEGPFGAWKAELKVPANAEKTARVEIVASDAAGNVSRRHLDIAVTAAPRSASRNGVIVLGLALVLLGTWWAGTRLAQPRAPIRDQS